MKSAYRLMLARSNSIIAERANPEFWKKKAKEKARDKNNSS
jgi:hypothetical protein